MKFSGFGEPATAALAASIFSGFVVAMQYEPSSPLISAVAMDAELPFGLFWRAFHFWSSQLFFILLLLHIIHRFDALPRIYSNVKTDSRVRWSVVSLTLPLTIMALFTGYVLRYDSTGMAAGAIAEHLMLSMPLIGQTIESLFLAIKSEGLNRVYAVHIILATACWCLGTWYHTKRIVLSKESFLPITIAVILWSCCISAPMDMPDADATLVKGPWFFIGVQELLRDLHPLYAGILVPSLPIAIVLFMPWRAERATWFAALSLWTIFYVGFTIAGVLR